MKKIFFVLAVLVVASYGTYAYALETSAGSAVVIEAQSGTPAYSKNDTQRRTMASTTKIMTAICAIEEADLNQKVKIPPEAVGVEGSSIYLRTGEELTLRELVYGLMLNSGNDSAVAIAYAVSGSVENFAKLMNTKAKEIGLCNTQFKNPNGLDEDGHYTTALDLARITAYGLKNPEFKKIVSTYQTTIPGSEEGQVRYLTNHNKLLKRYPGCIGVKTGFTKKSGRCLVSAAERNGVTLVAVTLSAPDDWNDHTKMLDFGFENVTKRNMVSHGEVLAKVPVEKGSKPYAEIVAENSFDVLGVKGKKYLAFFQSPENVVAPLKAGEQVGVVELYMEDKLIGTVPAVVKESVGEDKTRHFGKSLNLIKERFLR